MEPTRIAFVNTRMPGINTFLIRDLRALMDRGVLVDLYLFDTRSLDPAFRDEVLERGGVVEKIPFPLGGGAFGAFLGELGRRPRVTLDLLHALGVALVSPAEGIRSLAVLPAAMFVGRRMRDRRTQRVHALWAGVPATVALWIRRQFGLPFSVSAHAWDLLQRTRMLPAKVVEGERLVVCSEFARGVALARVGEVRADRVALVHHGLELEDWPYREPGADRPSPLAVLAVGRLMPKKGFDDLIEACALLRERGCLFRCRIVGPDGGSGPMLAARIAELGLEAVVEIAGPESPEEVRRSMRAADLLCCPSVTTERSSDGIPNVVLEAMALGLPVVTSDAGGLAEVVVPESTGLRVGQRDPRGLADAMERAWRDWQATRQRAAAARRGIEESFASERTAQQFLGAIGIGPVIGAGLEREKRHENEPALG